MASIQKHGAGWRAQVFRLGKRQSKVFPTQREAKDWAARQEYLITEAPRIASTQPFRDVLDRYAREVSRHKRGHRWEALRLEALGRDPLGALQIGRITTADISAWRDRRQAEVAAGTVLREMTLVGHVLTVARRDWGLIAVNPMTDVRRPAAPPARDRLPTAEEMERLAHAAGDDLSTATARAWHAFRFACATAMRAGEIVGLTQARIDAEARVAHLPLTKNGRAREVPLSGAAMAMLAELPPMDPVFGLTSRQLDALWRKIRGRAKVEGLRFHDSRAYALTMMARKVDVLTLARISGHRDIRLLSNVYYRETAADIARRLD